MDKSEVYKGYYGDPYQYMSPANIEPRTNDPTFRPGVGNEVTVWMAKDHLAYTQEHGYPLVEDAVYLDIRQIREKIGDVAFTETGRAVELPGELIGKPGCFQTPWFFEQHLRNIFSDPSLTLVQILTGVDYGHYGYQIFGIISAKPEVIDFNKTIDKGELTLGSRPAGKAHRESILSRLALRHWGKKE